MQLNTQLKKMLTS